MHPVGKVRDKCRAKRLGTGGILCPKLDWSRCIRFEMVITVVNRLIFQQFVHSESVWEFRRQGLRKRRHETGASSLSDAPRVSYWHQDCNTANDRHLLSLEFTHQFGVRTVQYSTT